MKAACVFATCVLNATSVAAFPCAQISDDAMRLACYDQEFRPQKTEVTSKPAIGEWAITHSKDALTDFNVTVLSLDAEGATSCFGMVPSIIIRCSTEGLAVFVAHGCFVPGKNGMQNVGIRHDQGEPATFLLHSSTDDRALGVWRTSDSLRFLRKIVGTSRMVMRIEPYRDPPQTIEFNVEGLAAALDEAEMDPSCHVGELIR